jgi:hypothetical protein
VRMTYVIHIVAGSLGLVSGYLALYSAKGATLHRRAGIVFVCAMVTMTFAGMMIAIVRSVAPAINIPAGLLSAYLVITALATVRQPAAWSRWLNLGGLLVALGVGLTTLTFAVDALGYGGGKRNEVAAFPFLMFGVVALLGSAGDVRMIRSGALRGAPRLARHLWRMSFALFIASLSFFIGQSQVFPKPIRIMPLLAMPMLLVLVTMFYWLWRVRVRRSLRGIVLAVRAPEAV